MSGIFRRCEIGAGISFSLGSQEPNRNSQRRDEEGNMSDERPKNLGDFTEREGIGGEKQARHISLISPGVEAVA